MNKIIYTLFAALVFIVNSTIQIEAAAPSSTPVKKSSVPITLKQNLAVQNVSPLLIVNNPSLYLNKLVSFEGEFVSFTSLGLDYKPAFRDGTKYIGILMKRPDIHTNTVPLSELKMFMTRELAEKNIDIETGDKFKLTGKIFSNALGDPWLDITEFKITDKKNKEKDKEKEKK